MLKISLLVTDRRFCFLNEVIDFNETDHGKNCGNLLVLSEVYVSIIVIHEFVHLRMHLPFVNRSVFMIFISIIDLHFMTCT